jgi:SHAQKYF class myb-like DNA-binding protein
MFYLGLARFGKNWKKIEQMIKTRSGSQVRSHAQKYFNKLGKLSDKMTSQHWDA